MEKKQNTVIKTKPIVRLAEYGWKGGDQPGDLLFENSLPDQIYEEISTALAPYVSKEILDIKSLEPAPQITGRFVVYSSENVWFVRISSRIGDADLESEILDYLNIHGVSVNPILFTRDFTGRLGQEYRLDVRPFIQGSHSSPGKIEIENLVEMIARMHRVLSGIPCRKKIKARAVKRYDHLNMIKIRLEKDIARKNLDIFHENRSWAIDHLGWLGKMALEFNLNFYGAKNAQPLHGELHRGNVIFYHGQPILVDFEESVHTYAPPAWDWAYFLQRFCFLDHSVGDDLGGKIPGNLVKFTDLKQIQYFIRQAAWFSIAVILDLRNRYHILTPASEYDKFVKLESQADILGRL